MHDSYKILHVVGSMDRGGVETWLMNIFRNIDRTHFEVHFLVSKPAPGAYDEEIRRLGGIIHLAPDPRSPLSFACALSSILHKEGPFDVVHSHIYLYSGIVLKVAKHASVPVRIAHSHTSQRTSGFNIARGAYELLMRQAVSRYASNKLAVSQQAGEALFGKAPPSRFQILYYGMDFSRFGRLETKQQLKQELGIPAERTVLGHVGRFVPVKNHGFILDAFHVVLRQRNAHLLLVGDGPLLHELQRRAASEGIRDRCTFTGLREDVAPCIGAMDVFLLPSLWEGLPLVTMEAQAAAVPVLVSGVVTREIDVVPGMVKHLPLEAGAEAWATAALQLSAADGCPAASADLMAQSKFSLERCISALEMIYCRTSQAGLQGVVA